MGIKNLRFREIQDKDGQVITSLDLAVLKTKGFLNHAGDGFKYYDWPIWVVVELIPTDIGFEQEDFGDVSIGGGFTEKGYMKQNNLTINRSLNVGVTLNNSDIIDATYTNPLIKIRCLLRDITMKTISDTQNNIHYSIAIKNTTGDVLIDINLDANMNKGITSSDFIIEEYKLEKIFREIDLKPTFDYFVNIKLKYPAFMEKENISAIFSVDGLSVEIKTILGNAYQKIAFPNYICFVYSDCVGFNNIANENKTLKIRVKWKDKWGNDKEYFTDMETVTLPKLPSFPTTKNIINVVDLVNREARWDVNVNDETIPYINGDIKTILEYFSVNNVGYPNEFTKAPTNSVIFETSLIPNKCLVKEGRITSKITTSCKFNLSDVYTTTGDSAATVFNKNYTDVITGPHFDIALGVKIKNVDTSEIAKGIVKVTLEPDASFITHCLIRLDIKNKTKTKTIFTSQFDDVDVNGILTATFDPEDLVKDCDFEIIVQGKATKGFIEEYVLEQKYFSTQTATYKTFANITTDELSVVYDKIRNSYVIKGKATLTYDGYDSLRIMCVIKDKNGITHVQDYLKYTRNPLNRNVLLIDQDLSALGFPASWSVNNPCRITISYEYV